MTSLSTGHDDMIHDAQVDYYGKRLASCSSDRTIRIFDLTLEQPGFLAELRGHEGPVWQVAWAHPKFGNLIASCSYDRKVLIWKETSPNQWSIIYQYEGHVGSVNSVAWAPHQAGAVVACASSDGCVSVLSYSDGEWSSKKFEAHKIGVNSISWAPAVRAGVLIDRQKSNENADKQFVTGGSDACVKIWQESPSGDYMLVDTLKGHKGWVRGVAWSPSIGLPSNVIASCGQDCSVIVWNKDDSSSKWTSRTLMDPPRTFPDVVWTVSWSVSGNILSVACGDGSVTLWKESLDGQWNCISEAAQKG